MIKNISKKFTSFLEGNRAMKTFILISLLSAIFTSSIAQVGIGTTVPHNSAALEIKDSARGILIPRLTMAQRLAIQNPAEGLMVYQKDSTEGYWHFDGVKWKSIYSSATTSSVGGKFKIVISDSVTSAQAAAIIAADFGPNTQEIFVIGCPLLTTLNLSMVTSTTNIFISDNPLLHTVNLSNLKTCTGHLYFQTSPLLNNLNLNSLETIFLGTNTSEYAFVLHKTRVFTLSLPALKSVVGSITVYENGQLTSINLPSLIKANNLGITFNYSLNSISAPLLTHTDLLFLDRNINLPTLSLPSLTSAGQLYIKREIALTTINFPVLARFTGVAPYEYSLTSAIRENGNLTDIVLGNIVQFSNNSFDAYGNKLTSSAINSILNKFVSAVPVITNKYFDLRQIPAAPPTGQGLIDKATLIANGNDVITN